MAPSLPVSRLESAIVSMLGDLGTASAREIYERIGEHEPGLVYTTAATVLDRLHAKGLAERTWVGKGWVYCATVKPDATKR